MERPSAAQTRGLSRGSRAGTLASVGDLQALNEIAASQHGAFSLAQARITGFDKHACGRRVDSGEWLRVDDSVLALASSPRTWQQSLWSTVLSRPKGLLTHDTALELLGLPDIPRKPPALLVPRGSNVRSGLARIYESDQFARISTSRIKGLPITTAPETILVFARDSTAERVEAAFDECLIRGLLDLDAMASTIDREAGRRTPGTPLLRKLTSSRRPTAPAKSSSYLEALLERILHELDLPPWFREHELLLGTEPARVDVFMPAAGLVIEADGRNWHTRRQAFESDRRRDNTLASRGIQVLRFTHDMVVNDSLVVRRQITETVRLRAA